MKKFLTVMTILIMILFFIGFQPGKSVDKLKKNYLTTESEFWEYGGMSIHYRVTGAGDPLVLLHGVASSLHTWSGWHEELSNDFKVISLDLPSFGLTGPHPNGDYSVEMYMEFLDNLCRHLQLDEIYLAGNSFGGFLTWQYAVHNQSKVKKIILLDAAGLNTQRDDITDLGFRLSMHPITKYLTWVYTPKFIVASSVKNVYGNPSLVTKQKINLYYDLLVRKGNRKGFTSILANTLKNGKDHAPAIKSITTPALVMWGGLDNLIPVSDAISFNDYIEHSELIIYEGIGHIPMEEIPEQSAQNAREFLLRAESNAKNTEEE